MINTASVTLNVIIRSLALVYVNEWRCRVLCHLFVIMNKVAIYGAMFLHLYHVTKAMNTKEPEFIKNYVF